MANTNSKTTDLFTFIICQVLGNPSDDPHLKTLAAFREKILLQDKQYLEEFAVYNELEPEIINYLNEGNTHLEFAQYLYDEFFTRMSAYISRSDYEPALDVYRKLVKILLVQCDSALKANRLNGLGSSKDDRKKRARRPSRNWLHRRRPEKGKRDNE